MTATFDISTAFSSAVRAAASGPVKPSPYSSFGPAAQERAAREQFSVALQSYRQAVRRTNEPGDGDCHLQFHQAHASLVQARKRASRCLTRAQLRALEESIT